jgi:hypothetical protein
MSQVADNAATSPSPPHAAEVATDLRERLLRSLVFWTREQTRLRRLAQSPVAVDTHDPSDALPAMLEQARSVLWPYVRYALTQAREFDEEPSPTPADPSAAAPAWEGSDSARTVAVLWFCSLLLEALAAKPRSPVWRDGATTANVSPRMGEMRWARFYADLSFVIRETVRFLCFGKRPDFYLQPAIYAASLATIVRVHAEHVLELSPRYEIGELLRRLGRSEGLNRGQQPVHHLVHVLDVYVCGYLLLSLRLADETQGDALRVERTIADVLASGSSATPGSAQGQSLQQAYALAALFHDVGYLLFPSTARPAPALARGDKVLQAGFERLEAALSASAEVMATPAADVLGQEPYCKRGNDVGLARWLDAQRQAPQPDHGLLGAYYLHHVCSHVGAGASAVQRQAVRAVVLHGANDVEIVTEADPAAAVLVLANELFEWDPERALGPAPSAVGRSFHLMRGSASPLEPRARAIWASLDWTDEPHGAARAPRLTRAGGRRPLVEMQLHLPHRLDAPVYHFWLLKAQRYGRVRASETGWLPRLRLHTPRDARLPDSLSMRTVLDCVVGNLPSPLRGALEEWLARVGMFETLDIDETTAFAPSVDLSALLSNLDQEVDLLVMQEVRSALDRSDPPAWLGQAPDSRL